MKFESRYKLKEIFDPKKPFDPQTGHLVMERVYATSTSADRFLETLEACLIAEEAVKIAERVAEIETIPSRDKKGKPRSDYYGKDGELKSEGHRKAKILSDAMGICEFYMNRLTPLNDKTMGDYMQAPKLVINASIGLKDNPVNPKESIFTDEQITQIPRISDKNRKLERIGVRNVSFDKLPSGVDPRSLYSPSGESGIYVRLLDDPLPPELMELYQDHWTRTDAAQLKAGKRLLPLYILMEYLMGKYGTQDAPAFLRSSIEADIRDMSCNHICALDGTVGRVGPRDDDLERSDSDLCSVYRAAPDAVGRLCAFARILHCVLMGSICVKEDKSNFSTELAFDSRRMFHLMDQHLFSINHPAHLVFVSAPGLLEHYRVVLAQSGIEDAAGNASMRIPDVQPGAIGTGVTWVENKDAFRIRQGQSVRIPMTEYDLSQGRSADGLMENLARIAVSETHPRDVILVTDRANRGRLESIMAGLWKKDNIRYMITLGDCKYITIREDLFDVVEIGITDIRKLFRFHMDDEDWFRIPHISDFLESMGLDGCKDARSALEGLRRLQNKSEDISDPMYRIPFETALEIICGLVKEENRVRCAVLGNRDRTRRRGLLFPEHLISGFQVLFPARARSSRLKNLYPVSSKVTSTW